LLEASLESFEDRFSEWAVVGFDGGIFAGSAIFTSQQRDLRPIG
jgi:hypothetical protein